MIIGYTAGVFDLFHVGHLNILRNAKALCDTLIVGVTTDELCEGYKDYKPVIPFSERIDIVRSCKFVDVAVAQNEIDKYETFLKLKFDVLFVGDDWFGDLEWAKNEQYFDIYYLPYTKHVSSTELKERINNED